MIVIYTNIINGKANEYQQRDHPFPHGKNQRPAETMGFFDGDETTNLGAFNGIVFVKEVVL